ncbi:MAG: hypothetical protein GWN58_52755 [Anaerolineae bacterium]|nr:hypothetical protein [Deltaproteobacteria bacterium]NIV37786.1 hypothetical protein [Anaerolineae bacterium]
MSDGPAGDQPGIYYNLSSGDAVYITQYRGSLTTNSDTLAYELGYTDAANGGGTFTPVTCEYHIGTGAANSGIIPQYFVLDPPLRITYSMGARSITFRATTNDAAATCTFAYHGWVEDE